ncbi:MAG: class I SAM-dependent methyltransferase [Parachlamydiales bacterium]|nr:class I SAM-dependent methyltransferase [Parachlamydiales bacterium]
MSISSLSKLPEIEKSACLALWALFLESRKKNSIYYDKKLNEMIDKLSCYFPKINYTSNYVLEIASRKELIKEVISKFINKNENSIIINLGCGLDNYFDRLNTTNVFWFDIDLSGVINLKKKFFRESDNYKLISKSIFDFSWLNKIPKNKKTLVLIEGLLPYFEEKDVKMLIDKIISNFPDSELIIHVISHLFYWYRSLSKISNNLKWSISNKKCVLKIFPDLKILKEYFIYDCHVERMSILKRILRLFPCYRKQNILLHLKSK